MLARLVPGPLVRFFARPYVAGDSLAAGLSIAADGLANSGVRTTLDLLGEDVRTAEQVQENVVTYRALIDAIAEDARFHEPVTRPSISVKPSAFTTGDQEAAFAEVAGLAEFAQKRSVALTIDMEDRAWTDITIERSVALFQRGLDVGTVLQTRLDRTAEDLEKIPAGMRLRLVIGIYPEPADIATTDKRVMKDRMLTCAQRLLDAGVFVEFATHDLEFTERFLKEVAPTAPERCEVQMLLGVPRGEFRRRLQSGDFGPKLPLRIYVPFAIGWDNATAYLRRRMEESPSVMWLVLRNLFSGKRNR